jgi:hypothetical protein
MSSVRNIISSGVLALFVLSVFIDIAMAGDSTRQAYVIELHNQVPETLIPAIKPLLAADDGISGFNNQLIITTDPQRIASILQLVSQLDKPLQNLLISVKNNNAGYMQNDNSDFSGGIKTGKVIIGTGQPVPSQSDGATIQSSGLSYSTNSTARTFSTREEQQIRAVEGNPAFIYTGESRQIPTRDRYGNVLSTEVDANKGFYVTARLIGDRVQLDIFVSNDAFDSSSNNSRQAVLTQQLSTTVNGRIGEWISLGGVTLGDNDSENSLAKKITTGSGSLGDISVKISPLNQ